MFYHEYLLIKQNIYIFEYILNQENRIQMYKYPYEEY